MVARCVLACALTGLLVSRLVCRNAGKEMVFYKFAQEEMVVQQQEIELWKLDRDGLQWEDQVAEGT